MSLILAGSDQILEPVVGSRLWDGHDFMLEEDNDSGDGGKGKNVVTEWMSHSLAPWPIGVLPGHTIGQEGAYSAKIGVHWPLRPWTEQLRHCWASTQANCV